MADVFVEPGSAPPPLSSDLLRYDVHLANGERVLDRGLCVRGDAASTPAGFSLVRTGGGGYATRDQLRLWPLPPAGTVEIRAQWAAMDLEVSRTRVDLRHLHQLAAAAQPLWQD